jgi:hypothetical protein
MLEKLDYKKRCLILFGGFLLFLYVGYQFSFSDTFTIAGEIKEKEQKLTWLKEKEKELPLLKAKMNEFEKAYSKKDSIAVRDKLTAYISDFAEEHSCLVTEIPVNSSFKNDDLKIQTNSFTIRGDFKNLVTLLSKLEAEYKYAAKIMSTRFFSVKDMQTKRKNLYLTIVTQSFEQKNT